MLYLRCSLRQPAPTIYDCHNRTVCTNCRKMPQNATTCPKKNFPDVVEVIKAKEGLDPFYSMRGFLVVNYFNLLKINLNSFYSNNKPKVLCIFYSKFIFLNIYL